MVVHKTSLSSSNPLGFIAALGLLAIAREQKRNWRISMDAGLVPWVLLHCSESEDEVLDCIMEDHERWQRSPAFGCLGNDLFDDVKNGQAWVRRFLQGSAEKSAADLDLATALIAERIIDGKANAKPTDLYFTAGKMAWLKMARELQASVTSNMVRQALFGKWRYESELPSFMWDIADDRVYALSAHNPAKVKKKTEPGAEWLALRGLGFFPVHPGSAMLLTTATGGRWKSGWMRWPIWSVAASPSFARTLLSSASLLDIEKNAILFKAWGVQAILQAGITRSDQGGYGTFRPPQVLWQRDN